MKLITLLLLTSCGTNSLRTWHKTTEYTEIGVKCAQEYYYSFKYGKCVVDHSFKPLPQAKNEAKLGLEIKTNAKNKPRTKTAKYDCSKLYTKLNKCSAIE